MEGFDKYGLVAAFSFKVEGNSQAAMGDVMRQLAGIENSVKSLASSLKTEKVGAVFSTVAQQMKAGVKGISTSLGVLDTNAKASAKSLDPLINEFKALKAESRNINLAGDLNDLDSFNKSTQKVREYITALEALETQVKGNSTAERQFIAALKDQQNVAGKKMDMAQAMRSPAQLASKGLAPLKDEFKALRAESRNIDFGADFRDIATFDRAAQEVREYTSALKALQAQVTGNTAAEREFVASLKSQQAIAQNRSSVAAATRDSARASEHLGMAQGVKNVGGSILGAIKQPMESARELQGQVANIKKLAEDVSAEGLVQIQNSIYRLASQTATKDIDVGSVFEDLASSMSFADAVLPQRIKETEQILKNAAALRLSVDQATQFSITQGSIYQKSIAKKLPGFGSNLELNQRMGSSVNELADRLENVKIAASDIIPVMNVVMNTLGDVQNFKPPDIAAYSAAVASLKVIDKKAAGSFFNRVSAVMSDKRYTGQFAETLGFDSKEEFGAALDTDKFGLIIQLIEKYQSLQGGELVKGGFLKGHGIGSVQDQKLIQGLGSNLPVLISARKVAQEGYDKNTSISTAFDKVSTTSAFQTQRLEESIGALKTNMGALLAEALTPAITALSDLTYNLIILAQAHPQLTKALVLGVAGFGAIATAAGAAGIALFGFQQAVATVKMASLGLSQFFNPVATQMAANSVSAKNPALGFFTMLKTKAAAIPAAMGAVATGIQTAGVAVTAFAVSPVGLGIIAVTGLVLAVEKLAPQLGLLGNILGGLGAPFAFVFGLAKGFLGTMLTTISKLSGGSFGAIAQPFGMFSSALQKAMEIMKAASANGEAVGATIANLIVAPVQMLSNLLGPLASTAGTVFSVISGGIATVTGGISGIVGVFTSAASAISGLWNSTIGGITGRFQWLVDAASRVGQMLVGLLAENSPGPTFQIREKWQATLDFLSGLFGTISNAATIAGNAISGAIGLGVSLVNQGLQTLNSFSFQPLIDIATQAGGIIGGAFDATIGRVGEAIASIRSMGASVVNVFSQPQKAVQNLGSTLASAGGNVLASVSGTVTKAVSSLSAIKTVLPSSGNAIAPSPQMDAASSMPSSEGLFAPLSSGLDWIKEKLQVFHSVLAQPISVGFTTAIANGVEWLKASLPGSIASVSEGLASITLTITSVLEPAFDSIRSAIAAAFAPFSTGVELALKFGDAIRGSLPNLSPQLANVSRVSETSLRDTTKLSQVSAVSQQTNSISQVASDISQQALTKLSDISKVATSQQQTATTVNAQPVVESNGIVDRLESYKTAITNAIASTRTSFASIATRAETSAIAESINKNTNVLENAQQIGVQSPSVLNSIAVPAEANRIVTPTAIDKTLRTVANSSLVSTTAPSTKTLTQVAAGAGRSPQATSFATPTTVTSVPSVATNISTNAANVNLEGLTQLDNSLSQVANSNSIAENSNLNFASILNSSSEAIADFRTQLINRFNRDSERPTPSTPTSIVNPQSINPLSQTTNLGDENTNNSAIKTTLQSVASQAASKVSGVFSAINKSWNNLTAKEVSPAVSGAMAPNISLPTPVVGEIQGPRFDISETISKQYQQAKSEKASPQQLAVYEALLSVPEKLKSALPEDIQRLQVGSLDILRSPTPQLAAAQAQSGAVGQQLSATIPTLAPALNALTPVDNQAIAARIAMQQKVEKLKANATARVGDRKEIFLTGAADKAATEMRAKLTIVENLKTQIAEAAASGADDFGIRYELAQVQETINSQISLNPQTQSFLHTLGFSPAGIAATTNQVLSNVRNFGSEYQDRMTYFSNGGDLTTAIAPSIDQMQSGFASLNSNVSNFAQESWTSLQTLNFEGVKNSAVTFGSAAAASIGMIGSGLNAASMSAVAFGIFSVASLSPIPLIVAAIAAGVAIAATNFLGLRTIISGVGQVFYGVLDSALSVGIGIVQAVRGVVTAVGGIIPALSGDFSQLGAGVGMVFDGIQTSASGLVRGLGSIFSGSIGVIQGIFEGLGQVVRFQVLQGIINTTAQFTANIRTQIEGLADAISNAIKRPAEVWNNFFNRTKRGAVQAEATAAAIPPPNASIQPSIQQAMGVPAEAPAKQGFLRGLLGRGKKEAIAPTQEAQTLVEQTIAPQVPDRISTSITEQVKSTIKTPAGDRTLSDTLAPTPPGVASAIANSPTVPPLPSPIARTVGAALDVATGKAPDMLQARASRDFDLRLAGQEPDAQLTAGDRIQLAGQKIESVIASQIPIPRAVPATVPTPEISSALPQLDATEQKLIRLRAVNQQAISSAGTAMSSMGGIVGSVAPQIAAPMFAVGDLVQNFGSLKDSLPDLKTSLTTTFPALNGMGAKAAPIFAKVQTAIAGVGPAVAGLAPVITPLLPVIGAVAAGAGAVFLAYKTNFLGIGDLINGIGSSIKGFFSGLFGGAMEIASTTFGTIGQELGGVFSLVGDIARDLSKPFEPLFALFASGSSEVGSAIIKGMLFPIQAVALGLTGIVRAISTVVRGVALVGGAIASFLLFPLTVVSNSIVGIVNAVRSIGGAIASIGTSIFGFLIAPFQQVWNLIQSIGSGLASIPFIGQLFGGGTPATPASTPTPTQAFSRGGVVQGVGSSTGDRVIAAVSPGEFVINAEATRQNYGLLDAINSGQVDRPTQAFSRGGLVQGVDSDRLISAVASGQGQAIGQGLGLLESQTGSDDLSAIRVLPPRLPQITSPPAYTPAPAPATTSDATIGDRPIQFVVNFTGDIILNGTSSPKLADDFLAQVGPQLNRSFRDMIRDILEEGR